MNQEKMAGFTEILTEFRLPRYSEIPNVGLYLEQAGKYVNEFLSPLGEFTLTPSMISNYVKKGIISSPVKKQYSRDQIAYLFFIAVTKSVLSLDALQRFIQLQQKTHSLNHSYDYFCEEFENILRFTFEISEVVESHEEDTSSERRLLYTCVVAAVQKVYMEKYLEWLMEEDQKD